MSLGPTQHEVSGSHNALRQRPCPQGLRHAGPSRSPRSWWGRRRRFGSFVGRQRRPSGGHVRRKRKERHPIGTFTLRLRHSRRNVLEQLQRVGKRPLDDPFLEEQRTAQENNRDRQTREDPSNSNVRPDGVFLGRALGGQLHGFGKTKHDKQRHDEQGSARLSAAADACRDRLGTGEHRSTTGRFVARPSRRDGVPNGRTKSMLFG